MLVYMFPNCSRYEFEEQTLLAWLFKNSLFWKVWRVKAIQGKVGFVIGDLGPCETVRSESLN